MQQKLQTILFFTFLICVQISYINSLKIKTKFKSTLSLSLNGTNSTNATVSLVATAAPAAPTASVSPAVPAVPAAPNATAATAATAAPAVVHHNHNKLSNQDLASNLENIQNNTVDNSHRNQFHIHHNVPRNLTTINNRLRNKVDNARNQLGELNDVQKETIEARLFHKFPKKPAGVLNAAVIDLRKGKIDEQSLSFNLTSIKDLSEAISQGNLQKTRTVTVDGMTYKLKKIGLNFFYGAIVGKGGIGAYLKDNYVTVITHNNFISFDNFAYFFGQVIEGLKDNKSNEKERFYKDNFDNKKIQLRTRLTKDKMIYNKEQATQ